MRAAAAAAALDRARPGVGAALPRWLLPGDRAPVEQSAHGADPGGAEPGGAEPGGAGRLDAPPPLAAALAAAVAAPVCVDVTVLDGATCLRGRWSLGAGPAAVLVLGADAAGAPRVEAGLVAAFEVAGSVARLLPPRTDPAGSPTAASGHPVRVCAADLLALSALDPPVADRLLRDLARTRGAPAADAVQRCVASTARVDLDVRCGTTTWCATWLLGPAWLRLDPGPEPGQLVAVPAGPPDVLDVLAGTLRAVALGGAAGRAGAPRPDAARAGATRSGTTRSGATRAGDPG